MFDLPKLSPVADSESRPRITLITVCYNSENTIADTLQSVDRQSFSDFEHLVIDGGSSDGTLAIVAAAAAPYRKVFSQKDEGIYDAMNKGLVLSRGEIIGFLNSDDVFAGDDILATVDAAISGNGVDSCYGDLVYVSQSDTEREIRYWKSSTFEPRSFRRGWCPPHPALYIRRAVYERAGMFDRQYRLAADVELMMRFMEKAAMSSLYIPRVMVRMRLGGATNKSMRNIYRQNREILRALASHGLAVSTLGLILPKLVNRLGQFARSKLAQKGGNGGS